MAENKSANMPFRTQPALKEAFEAAFEQQIDYASVTAYFEDAMRALIVAVRRKERISLPLEILTRPTAE